LAGDGKLLFHVDQLHAYALLGELRDDRLHCLAELAALRRELQQGRLGWWRDAGRAGENDGQYE
jgi:hypothetical protein